MCVCCVCVERHVVEHMQQHARADYHNSKMMTVKGNYRETERDGEMDMTSRLL